MWNAERKCDAAFLIGRLETFLVEFRVNSGSTWRQYRFNKEERHRAAYSFGIGCKIRS